MAGPRHAKPERRVVLLGCEGRSEEGYGLWMNQVARRRDMAITIRPVFLGGGDPLAIVEAFEHEIAARRRRGRRYAHHVLFVDGDRLGEAPARDDAIPAIVRRAKMVLIWQSPGHEAFLLRHFECHQHDRPTMTVVAERRLERLWPAYRKGMNAAGYGAVLTAEHFDRVRLVEPEFDAFLDRIGWPRE